jgi:hypothetical protein
MRPKRRGKLLEQRHEKPPRPIETWKKNKVQALLSNILPTL